MTQQTYLILIRDGRLALSAGAALEDQLAADGHRGMTLVPSRRGTDFADGTDLGYLRQASLWGGTTPQLVALYEDGLLDMLRSLGLVAYVGVPADHDWGIIHTDDTTAAGVMLLPVATARDLVDAIAAHTPWHQYATPQAASAAATRSATAHRRRGPASGRRAAVLPASPLARRLAIASVTVPLITVGLPVAAAAASTAAPQAGATQPATQAAANPAGAAAPQTGATQSPTPAAANAAANPAAAGVAVGVAAGLNSAEQRAASDPAYAAAAGAVLGRLSAPQSLTAPVDGPGLVGGTVPVTNAAANLNGAAPSAALPVASTVIAAGSAPPPPASASASASVGASAGATTGAAAQTTSTAASILNWIWNVINAKTTTLSDPSGSSVITGGPAPTGFFISPCQLGCATFSNANNGTNASFTAALGYGYGSQGGLIFYQPATAAEIGGMFKLSVQNSSTPAPGGGVPPYAMPASADLTLIFGYQPSSTTPVLGLLTGWNTSQPVGWDLTARGTVSPGTSYWLNQLGLTYIPQNIGSVWLSAGGQAQWTNPGNPFDLSGWSLNTNSTGFILPGSVAFTPAGSLQPINNFFSNLTGQPNLTVAGGQYSAQFFWAQPYPAWMNLTNLLNGFTTPDGTVVSPGAVMTPTGDGGYMLSSEGAVVYIPGPGASAPATSSSGPGWLQTIMNGIANLFPGSSGSNSSSAPTSPSPAPATPATPGTSQDGFQGGGGSTGGAGANGSWTPPSTDVSGVPGAPGTQSGAAVTPPVDSQPAAPDGRGVAGGVQGSPAPQSQPAAPDGGGAGGGVAGGVQGLPGTQSGSAVTPAADDSQPAAPGGGGGAGGGAAGGVQGLPGTPSGPAAAPAAPAAPATDPGAQSAAAQQAAAQAADQQAAAQAAAQQAAAQAAAQQAAAQAAQQAAAQQAAEEAEQQASAQLAAEEAQEDAQEEAEEQASEDDTSSFGDTGSTTGFDTPAPVDDIGGFGDGGS